MDNDTAYNVTLHMRDGRYLTTIIPGVKDEQAAYEAAVYFFDVSFYDAFHYDADPV